MNEARDYLREAGLTEGQIGNLEAMGYFRQPASKGHHLSGYGGLARHSANVTSRLVQLTNCLCVRWPRPESPYVVGMLHDLVKLQCYRLKGETEGWPEWEYVQPVYPGHGACSAAIAAQMLIGLYEQEIVAITYHMGLYGVGREYTDKEFDNALRLHGSQVLATCMADWYAARVDEEDFACMVQAGKEKQ